jgi:asparagine synthase (glutamine-hydrolysing)
MTPSEIVTGFLFGQAEPLPAPPRLAGRAAHPRAVLEDVIGEALRRPPCGVAFSGGRDSSLVLAVATHVARRDGVPDPIPITRRFGAAPRADEAEWQELVVRHLGLREWVRIELVDELDVVGPVAQQHLREHGVVWPPAIAGDVPLVEAVPGGVVLDGEGGDQVLGFGSHRIAPIAVLARRPRSGRRALVAAAGRALLPARWRGRDAAARALAAVPRPWLRPAAMELVRAGIAAAEGERPLAYRRSARAIIRRRAEVEGGRNRRLLARERGADLVSPLLDPRFVDALATWGGVLGGGDRTAVLRRLGPDLLPDAVLARTSKAAFNTCYMAAHTRRFAESWDGTGVDEDLVDGEQLRRAWLADWPVPLTGALLQQAWLAAIPATTGVPDP